MDAVFKALADPSRRELLDRLNARNGQTLTELCDGLHMARQSVTKHLTVLEAAGLVTTARRGREKLHYLNAAPINDIADRWIGRYHRRRARALADLKRALEDTPMPEPESNGEPQAEFVYSTYIRTTPETLWAALTTPDTMREYWGVALYSDWKPGSPVRWRSKPDEPLDPDDTVVLESDPPRRLSYVWHNYQPDHAEMFGWSQARLARLREEPLSKVSFAIEPQDRVVKLTVTHRAYVGDSEMIDKCSQGWPAILANLKTLLETGELLFTEEEAKADR
jgi:uncharacterized protein YndB with AHSA1/START domain/DNA-binding transcriptional ArsR family regulator